MQSGSYLRGSILYASTSLSISPGVFIFRAKLPMLICTLPSNEENTAWAGWITGAAETTPSATTATWL